MIKYAELDRIKRLDLPGLMGECGIKLKHNGNGGYSGLCPFHNDTNPSLKVDRKNGRWLWHCFGCGAKGTVLDFVMQYEKISFPQAYTKLSGNQSSIPKPKSRITSKTPKAPQKSLNPTVLKKLLLRTVEFYKRCFIEDKRGKRYLSRERGITQAGLYEQFGIGYSDGKLLEAIPPEGEVVEGLKALGLLTDKGREFFKGCVVFPVFDEENLPVHLYGRKIKEGGPVHHLYLAGDHQGVWNWNCLRQNPEVILVESIIDALAVYQAGFKNVIPLYGTNGFTPEHERLFKKYNLKEVVLLLDGDEAGSSASLRLKEKLIELGLNCHVAELPEGEDPNSYLLKHTPEELEAIVFKTKPGKKETPNRVYELIEGGFEVRYGERCYHLRGIESRENRLKTNLRALSHRRFHIDTLDLYSARARRSFILETSRLYNEEEEIIEEDLRRIIETAEAFIRENRATESRPVVVTDQARGEALRLARKPDLLEVILGDFEKLGCVGEEVNKLLSYIAVTSRKMEEPLSVIVLSCSGSGKSMLQDAALSFCPEEELIKLTSLTGRALFYKKETSLKYKALAIEEEAGAEEASYAIRNLISSKKLTIEATVKDPVTGKMTTMQNTVLGPCSIFKTTTNLETDAETRSRFFVLSVDESLEQTRRILDIQRMKYTIEGLLAVKESEAILERHRNFQRLLKPIAVVNPYASLLTYLDDRLLVRREHPKYMNLIAAITFLHQYQRPIKTAKKRGGESIEYIETTIEDIERAGEIAHQVLGRSLDELSDSSRDLLMGSHRMVSEQAKASGKKREKIEFSRRQLREYLNWSDFRLRAHLNQLVELEYLIPVAGKRGEPYRYRIFYNGEGLDGKKFLPGLINLEELKERAKKAGMPGRACPVEDPERSRRELVEGFDG